MPERNPTKNPMVILGTNVESGTPNTGQINYTQGGSKTYSKMSGVVGPDVLIVAGGGRIDSVNIHPSAQQAASGLPIFFYDSAVAVSGGPLSTSGHKVVFAAQGPLAPNASGMINYGGNFMAGYVFTSGLCHTTASGQPGFTVSYTPVTSN